MDGGDRAARPELAEGALVIGLLALALGMAEMREKSGASAANALPASSRETSGLVTSSSKSFESSSARLSMSRLLPMLSICFLSRARSNSADA